MHVSIVQNMMRNAMPWQCSEREQGQEGKSPLASDLKDRSYSCLSEIICYVTVYLCAGAGIDGEG